MPNKKISQLPVITSLTGTETIPALKDSIVKKTTTGVVTNRMKDLARYSNYSAIQDIKESAKETLFEGLSAGSVLQQDITAVSGALHRSPNTVTAMFVYDTSKDSDGGAWTEKCQHTSWYNEPLSGKWLGSQYNDSVARINPISISSTNLITNGTFDTDTAWTKGAGWSIDTTTKKAVATNASNGQLTQTISTVAGKTYLLQFDVVSSYAGVDRLYMGGTVLSQTTLGTGTHKFVFTANAASYDLKFQGYGGAPYFSGTIDNVSVREVTLDAATNSFYQGTDGNFYKIYKNLLPTTSTLSAWSKSSNISFARTTDTPISGLASQKVVLTGTAQTYITSSLYSASQITISCYAKKGEMNYLNIGYWYSTGDANNMGGVQFDLNTGTVLRDSGTYRITSVVPTITSIGNNWYRCTATFFSIQPSANISFAPSNTVWTSGHILQTITANNEGIYISSVQAEYGNTASTYEDKSDSSYAVKQVFRGNKAEFPKLAGIVAESGSVTIYDLTESGKPMWMRFIPGYTYTTSRALLGPNTQSTVSALNGVLVTGSQSNSGYQGSIISFITDKVPYLVNGAAGSFNGNIAQRNEARGFTFTGGYGNIISTSINSVSLAILPNAPVDAITNLTAITIALATAGGISIIKHDGTVVSSALTSAFNKVTITPKALIASSASNNTFYYALNPGKLSTGFTLLTESSGIDFNQGNTTVLNQKNRSELSRASGAKIQLLKNNESSITKGATATITPTYNTGYMVGDVRRSYLTSVAPGTISSTAYAARGLFPL